MSEQLCLWKHETDHWMSTEGLDKAPKFEDLPKNCLACGHPMTYKMPFMFITLPEYVGRMITSEAMTYVKLETTING